MGEHVSKLLNWMVRCAGSYDAFCLYYKAVSEVICWNKEEMVRQKVIRRMGKD